MSIRSILAKGIEAMVNEAKIPKSFKDGQEFENYVQIFCFAHIFQTLGRP